MPNRMIATSQGMLELWPPSLLYYSNVPSTIITTTTSLIPWTAPQMFIPLGSGTLYYHAITSPTVAHYWHAPPTRSTPSSWTYADSPHPLPKPALLRYELVKQGRLAFRKSVDLFRKFRSEREIRTFLEGKPLIIHGHQYDYRVQKRANLLRLTMNPNSAHIPYDLYLMSKDGRTLAKGCVVVPGTPVIDQLLALILHVEDEVEEQTVINVTNWTPPLNRRTGLPLAA
jgi:hypothetical protein